MARKFVLVDDIDESEDDVQTVSWTVDGRSFEAELGTKNRTKFYAQLEYWNSHARSAGSKRKSSSSPPAAKAKTTGSGLDKTQLDQVREWARKQGTQVSDRGRISADIIKAYEEAHAGGELFSA